METETDFAHFFGADSYKHQVNKINWYVIKDAWFIHPPGDNFAQRTSASAINGYEELLKYNRRMHEIFVTFLIA